MQSKSHITVVSEGRLFKGVRTPVAFSWVEAERSEVRPTQIQARRPTSNLAYVFGQLAHLKLAKHDLALRRQQAASLSPAELEHLATILRASIK